MAEATGDCFPTAAHVAMELAAGGENVRVVHGRPMGQGPHAGRRIWHAWVEVTRVIEVPTQDGSVTHEVELVTAVDRSNGKDLEVPAVLYRSIGELDGDDVVWSWTLEEAHQQMVTYGHYGPWVDGWEEYEGD